MITEKTASLLSTILTSITARETTKNASAAIPTYSEKHISYRSPNTTPKTSPQFLSSYKNEIMATRHNSRFGVVPKTPAMFISVV
jgi:hypothetical protein